MTEIRDQVQLKILYIQFIQLRLTHYLYIANLNHLSKYLVVVKPHNISRIKATSIIVIKF